MVYNGMGSNYIYCFNHEKALEYSRLNLSISRHLDDHNGICDALDHFSMVEYIRGNYDSAADYYKEVLELIKKYKFSYVNCFVKTNLGKIYREKRNYEKSLEYLNEAKDSYER